MKSVNLADLLGFSGLRARQFLLEVDKFEKRLPNGKSVSAEILGEIYQNSAEILRLLGFSNNEITLLEAQNALKNKLLGDHILIQEDGFWEEFSASVILCENGIISSNKNDVEAFISSQKSSLENFQQNLKEKICQEFSNKLPTMSIDKIKEKLFKEKK